jgi:hypothetical protein
MSAAMWLEGSPVIQPSRLSPTEPVQMAQRPATRGGDRLKEESVVSLGLNVGVSRTVYPACPTR